MADDDERRREVARQARVGAFNRRSLAGAGNASCRFVLPDFREGIVGKFLCTCGRNDCDELLVVPLAEYRFVKEKPYRFLVAPAHATQVDDVILSTDEYEVVEVKPAFRGLAASIIGDAPSE